MVFCRKAIAVFWEFIAADAANTLPIVMVGSTFLLICQIEHRDARHIPPHLRKPLDKIKALWRQLRDISVTTEDSIAANFILVIRLALCTTFFFRRSDDMSHRIHRRKLPSE